MKINNIELTKIEENVLRVALDHMEEYLDDLVTEMDGDVKVFTDRKDALLVIRLLINRKERIDYD